MSAGMADYIGAFSTAGAIDPARSALLVIDMQHATGSRDGALARRVMTTPEGRRTLAYRFERIETRVVPAIRRLLDAFRGRGLHVVHVTIGAQRPDAADAPPHMRKFFAELGNHVGAPDHAILPELAPLPGEPVVNKTTNGAFASTGIDSLLRALRADHLVMAGISTNMCVETTAREAADRGYAVTLVEDACGATHPESHAMACFNIGRLFGRVASTDAVLAEVTAHGVRHG